MKLTPEQERRAREMAGAGHTSQFAAAELRLPFSWFQGACQKIGIRWQKLSAAKRKALLGDELNESAVRYSAGAMDRAKLSLKRAIAEAKFQIENKTAPPYKGHMEDFF